MQNNFKFLERPNILAQGKYFQIVTKITLLDEAIIRSNDPEEVLTFGYKEEKLGNRFIIPWRKIKGKFRRVVQEHQRSFIIAPECHLKDNLCMNCPTCFLFGGTGETSNAKVSYNILSRVLGETFISATPVGTVTSMTENAVDEKTLMTGQALMSVITVPKETTFIGVITLKDPTKEMAKIVVENLDRLTRIGARSVEWGRCKTEIIGIKTGDRETVTVYDILKNDKTSNNDIIKNYKLTETNSFKLPDVKKSFEELNKQVFEILGQLKS